MLVELHILQNFAPSNLNRDDTNSPKQCDFGGYRRARVSSQSWKRAMRSYFESRDLIPGENRSIRTKRLVDRLVRTLADSGKLTDQADAVARALLRSAKLDFDSKTGLSQYLLFLGEREVDEMASIILENWDVLVKAAATDGAGKTKKDRQADVPPEIKQRLDKALDGGRAASVALFGRMLADAPELNIDAAAQVAHAISTHAVEAEFDFYTAVDDLKPEDTAGADMMGTIEFNSACYYRYMDVDVDQLNRNLQEDSELVRATVTAFLLSAINSIPTGKQNSMAAHNPPSLILAVVGDGPARSLANAFAKPVYGRRGDGLISASAEELLRARTSLGTVYGTDLERGAWLCKTSDVAAESTDATQVASADQLVQSAVEAACSHQVGRG
jgi:CRISPR system Cascade subunit CasC